MTGGKTGLVLPAWCANTIGNKRGGSAERQEYKKPKTETGGARPRNTMRRARARLGEDRPDHAVSDISEGLKKLLITDFLSSTFF